MADLIGKTIAEKYRIEELIKHSPTSDLYRATHLLIDKPVSVKVLPALLKNDIEATERFFEEARQTARISHPNILNIIDFGTDSDGTPYAVCDSQVAESLRSVMLRDGPLPVDVAIDLTRQAALALDSGHEASVIHGNLSPESILLQQDPEGRLVVKVSDFGTPNAMMLSGGPLEESSSDFAYLASELCSGAEHPDERSDIYSLGAILYEMLAGTAPFLGEKPTDVMLKHVEEPPAPLVAFRGDLPPEIESVILKAMSKDPAMRQQTMLELIDDLYLKAEPQAAAATAANSGGDFWKTAFLVLIGTGALAAALIYATSVKQTDPQTVLMPDADGQPVQPINPATGFEEQQLAVMPGALPDYPNSSGQPSGALPGGDGYDPWAAGAPPLGAPAIPPGGQVITIDPNNPSQFMPPDGGVILVPVPANANTKPSPSPSPARTPSANTNTAPSPTPVSTPPPAATPKPDPKPSPPKPAPDNSTDPN